MWILVMPGIRGSFAEAFAEHEIRFKDKIDDVKTWRAAFTEVAYLDGWHLENKSESEVIKKIIQRINSVLDREVPLVSDEHLVGMDYRVKKMLNLCLGEGLNCVRLIGIWGMGGIGKTTLAREIYNRIFRNFEACSFIANVRVESESRGLVSLQNNILSTILMGTRKNILGVEEGKKILRKRLCNKKVLIVLDDVNNGEQLKALVGKDWFGPGSIIIVTSRDSQLLKAYWDGVIDIYEAKVLNSDEAMELFSLKAFKKPHPEENYVDLCKNFVNYAKGLPLALRVLGSSLFGKKLDVWRSARDKLEANPNRDIMDVLVSSFERLEDTQKELFLDIVCLFNGMVNYCIRGTLESLGHYTCDIDVLEDKSLITSASYGALWMHDLLKEMGRYIVRREFPEEPGKHSRLCRPKDVLHVLKSNDGTKVVKGIMLNMPTGAKERLSAEAFAEMKNLKFLKIGYAHPRGDLIGGPIQLPQGLSYLSKELRIIDWFGYPLKSMPISFQPDKLVELRLRNSEVKQLWKGIMILNELKLIDLSDSQNLIEIPDLSRAPNLEQLILQRCTRLYKIHASLGDLKRLIRLDLNGCKHLESLPHKINLEALETFDLSGCSKLKKFPCIVENMPHLWKLCLSETAITGLPLSIEHLIGLTKLDLRDCKNLSSLPNGCYSSMSLKILNLSGCSKLDELPKNLVKIESLEELDLSGTAITGLLSSVVHLKNLKVLSLSRSPDPMGMLERSLIGLCSLTKLNLSHCNVETIPNALGCLSSLEHLDLRGNNFVSLPESIIQLSNLTGLKICGCAHLRMLPKLPLNIVYIHARQCTSLETLSLRPEDNFCPYFDLLSCNKLIKNQGYGDLVSTMLRRYFINTQGQQDDKGFSLTIPGSEIPNWFSHRYVGGSVNLQVPSGNKLMGIVLCAVFVFRQHHPLHRLCIDDDEDMIITHHLGLCVEYPDNTMTALCLSEEFGKIESYQLWLKYIPTDDSSQIYIFEPEGPGLEVTKCGAHLVFERDIEDLINQTKAGSSSCIITSYDQDGLENLEKGTKIKRSRDDSDGEEAGPSGEATSNDVDEPHPKRMRLPNLIERLFPRLRNWLGNSSTQEQGDSEVDTAP